MRIALASDLHNEFYVSPPKLEVVDADILVLAGDIQTSKTHNEEWWEETAAYYDRVIYIRGNHEYYGTYYTEYPELRFPQNVYAVGRTPQYINIEGVRFLCGTMWTDLSNPIVANLAQGRMNDYRKIKYSRSKWWFLPENTTDEFITFQQFLRDKLCDVVITHHLPSYGSVPQEFRLDNLNAAYATEIDIDGPKLWVHGHTHTPCDYVKNDCRIVCNPMGYPDQNGPYTPKVIEYDTSSL